MNIKGKSPEEIFDIIRECCAELGWTIGMDMSDTTIIGAIIGRRDYLDSVLLQLNEEDQQNYDIYEYNEENLELH